MVSSVDERVRRLPRWARVVGLVTVGAVAGAALTPAFRDDHEVRPDLHRGTIIWSSTTGNQLRFLPANGVRNRDVATYPFAIAEWTDDVSGRQTTGGLPPCLEGANPRDDARTAEIGLAFVRGDVAERTPVVVSVRCMK